MTREEAIKILKAISVYECYPKSASEETKEAIDMAIEALADRPTKWIPVSERLPIPPTFCLVTTDGSHGDVIDIALYMSDGWHKASEVLAWMSLPEPYIGGESDG